VGDYRKGQNASLQLRNISRVLFGPADLRVTKIKPITLAGFFPVALSTDPDKPTPAQRITVVGYGANSTWEFYYDEHSFPGQALQTSLEVLEEEFCKEGMSDPSFNGSSRFCAASVNAAGGIYPFDEIGPCLGECCCYHGSFACALSHVTVTSFHRRLPGDYGSPALDENGALVGLTDYPICTYSALVVGSFIEHRRQLSPSPPAISS
jgi:hypothetical protein